MSSSILQFTPQMDGRSGQDWVSAKPSARSSIHVAHMGDRDPMCLAHLPLLQAITRELAEKQSSQDMSQCPYERLALQAVAVSATWGWPLIVSLITAFPSLLFFSPGIPSYQIRCYYFIFCTFIILLLFGYSNLCSLANFSSAICVFLFIH